MSIGRYSPYQCLVCYLRPISMSLLLPSLFHQHWLFRIRCISVTTFCQPTLTRSTRTPRKWRLIQWYPDPNLFLGEPKILIYQKTTKKETRLRNETRRRRRCRISPEGSSRPSKPFYSRRLHPLAPNLMLTLLAVSLCWTWTCYYRYLPRFPCTAVPVPCRHSLPCTLDLPLVLMYNLQVDTVLVAIAAITT